MTTPSVRILEETVRKNGFTYKQVFRNEKVCIYSQYTEEGTLRAYEVFFHKLGDLKRGKKRFAALRGEEFDESSCEDLYEMFPGDEEFGKRAWSCKELEKAKLYLNI